MDWFRLYGEFATDPKVQMLSESDQRRYIMVLCLRCSNGDVTLQDEEIAFQLRISNEEWARTKSILQCKGMITDDNKPTAWDKRQFRSDSSAERVAAHRAKKKSASSSDVTLQERKANVVDSDTDTDTEKEEACAAIATPPAPPAEQKKKTAPISFDAFVDRRKAAGEKLIAEDDPIFDWAESAGIPDDWLRLAWVEFSARYRGNAKRYADWPATFRNAVRGNWFKLWRIADAGNFVLTTEGEMGRRAAEAKTRQPMMEATA